MTGFVSNGNGTPGVLEYLRPWIDVYKVDLKSFDDRHYRELGGRLQPILDTIRQLHDMDVWLELVTLLIPGFNDSDDELKRLTEFVAGVSPDIPWHVTAFHGDYKMTDPSNTTPQMLDGRRGDRRRGRPAVRVCGQLPGQVGSSKTRTARSAARCSIERHGYLIRGYNLTPDGRLPFVRHAHPRPLERCVHRTAHRVSHCACSS